MEIKTMEYMTIPKLAQKLELSDNTVRRYTKNYPQFFRKEIIDGWEQYPLEEAVALIKRINEISQAGKRRVDVLTDLEKGFEVVTPMHEKDTELDPGNGNTQIVEFGPASMAVLKRIATALEGVTGCGKA
jgi:hypothetical protein